MSLCHVVILKPPRFIVADTNLDLRLTDTGDSLFVHSSKAHTMPATKVLFSFGSGDWVDGMDAQELTSDIDGRWLSFQIHNLNHRVIVDRKACASPLDQRDFVKHGNVIGFDQVLDAMVAAGEINVSLTHHNLTRDTSVWTVSPKGELVFRLDPRTKDKTVTKPKKKTTGKGKAKAKAKAKVKEEHDDDAVEAHA